MSEKVKKILDKTNIVLLILCIIMFIVLVCRLSTTYIDKIDTYNDSRENAIVKIIENNEPKKIE